MADEATEQQHTPSEWRRIWRQTGQQAAHLAGTVVVVALLALSLGALAAWLQAGRDETRAADLALIIAPAVPPAGLAEHGFELYRRGYAPTLVLVGEGRAALWSQLAELGVPETGIVEGPASATTADLRLLAREARADDAASALVVTAPEEQLRAIKIARDQGLRAYGAPQPRDEIEPLRLVGASLRYWRYVLLGL